MTMTAEVLDLDHVPPPTEGFQIVGNPGHIFGALAKAQGGFQPIHRSKTVKVSSDKGSYTFDYAPLDVVLAATVPSLTANGLCLFHTLGHHGQDVILTTILGHESGSSLMMFLRLPGTATQWKDGKSFERAKTSQEMASDVTYRRRYMVSCLLGVSAEEDDDGAAGEQMDRTVNDKGPRQATQQKPPVPKAPPTAAKQERPNVIQMEKPEPKPEPKPSGPPPLPIETNDVPARREQLLEIKSLLKELGFTSGPGSMSEKWCVDLIGIMPSQSPTEKQAAILLADLHNRKAS
jgi:hypothetical protein